MCVCVSVSWGEGFQPSIVTLYHSILNTPDVWSDHFFKKKIWQPDITRQRVSLMTCLLMFNGQKGGSHLKCYPLLCVSVQTGRLISDCLIVLSAITTRQLLWKQSYLIMWGKCGFVVFLSFGVWLHLASVDTFLELCKSLERKHISILLKWCAWNICQESNKFFTDQLVQ